MPEIKTDILATLAYFDLFDFPLTEQELHSYLPQAPAYFPFSIAVREMVRERLLYRIDGFYLLRPQAVLVTRRREGEKKAASLLKTAKGISRWLACFPFVRGVAVSGSLSKNFADDHSDIDFFIVTAAGRLWIARTLLHLFKKLSFLAGREDYFCMNYFVDEARPEIIEKNIYTAIEVATLIPMVGENAFRTFFFANRWTTGFLPNRKTPALGAVNNSWLQRGLEKFIDLACPQRLEKYLMNSTARRWNKKTAAAKKTSKGHILEMDLSAHCSKPAATGFHDALMSRYRCRLDEVLHRTEKMATR